MIKNVDDFFEMDGKSLMCREQCPVQWGKEKIDAGVTNDRDDNINFHNTSESSDAAAYLPQQVAREISGYRDDTADFYAPLKHRGLNPGLGEEKEIKNTKQTRSTLSYQTSLSFLDGKIKSMIAALKR